MEQAAAHGAAALAASPLVLLVVLNATDLVVRTISLIRGQRH